MPSEAVGQASAPRAETSIEQAISRAAQRTNIDFDFLVAQAQVESAMDPNARASTSSATGLYQFIDSTWLGTMKRHGARFGMGDIAARIGTNSSGHPHVAEPATREAILSLRNDPQIASLMAAGLAEDNREHLAPILGRQPDHSELYLAHFMGAGAAGRFLTAMAENPDQSAAAMFRAPAAANRPIFFQSNGSPRSLAGVMDHLTEKLYRAGAAPRAESAEPSAPFSDRTRIATTNTAGSSRRSRPVFANVAPPAFATPPPRSAMSSLLRTTFGDDPGNPKSARHISRAYEQLKAMGL